MITAISIVLAVLAVILVVLVLMQQGKNKNLSGAIAGSANGYGGKGRTKGSDRLLSRLTLILSIVFVLVVLFMYILQDVKTTDGIIDDNYNQTEAAE